MAEEPSLLDKLDSVAPIAKFDAFPKLPSTYKTRSESRGFMTVFVALLAFLLVLNDIGEFIWGWPDFEFSVDSNKNPFLNINVDMVVAMPCGFLSVDLRDAMGDRLFLTGGFRRDGTFFDVGQATALKEHSQALSARQAIAQSRNSRGVLAWIFRREKPLFKPSYTHTAAASACRITGSLAVKRVTANLHITTLGHGYSSYEHVDHNQMNLSHIITEFSFGPHFPDIVQPLDNSFEATDKRRLHRLPILPPRRPTTYIAPRTAPLHTHQYAVTHYTREVAHDRGTPGIFFKFDLDPARDHAPPAHDDAPAAPHPHRRRARRRLRVHGLRDPHHHAARSRSSPARTPLRGSSPRRPPACASAGSARSGAAPSCARARRAAGSYRRAAGGPWRARAAAGVARAGRRTRVTRARPSRLRSRPRRAEPYSPQVSLPGSPALGASLSAFGPPRARRGWAAAARRVGGAYAIERALAAAERGDVPARVAGARTPGVGYATFPPTPNPVNGGGFSIAPPPPRKIVPKKDD
ncbi:endoplasmic reticulum-golgi intermediate compartment protein 2 [Pholiota molesta]|nr:endoplasmic reticulum-golgi intermediate compartment protein 2 [Pholiota molesta]